MNKFKVGDEVVIKYRFADTYHLYTIGIVTVSVDAYKYLVKFREKLSPVALDEYEIVWLGESCYCPGDKVKSVSNWHEDESIYGEIGTVVDTLDNGSARVRFSNGLYNCDDINLDYVRRGR